MKRSIFNSDHEMIRRSVSRVLNLTDDPDKMSADLIKLQRKMLSHIFREETFVFSSSELFASHALLLGLMTEHAGMLRMIDKILSYIKNGDIERATDRLAGLNRLLLVHCDREEREIYDLLARSGVMQEISVNANRKRMPKGWKPYISAKYDEKS